MFEADGHKENWIPPKYVFLAILKLQNENYPNCNRKNRQQQSYVVDGGLRQKIGILHFL